MPTDQHLDEAVVELANGSTIRTNTYHDYPPGSIYLRTCDEGGRQTGHWLASELCTGDPDSAGRQLAAILAAAGGPLEAGWHKTYPAAPMRHPDTFPPDHVYRYDELYYTLEGEAIIALANGWTLRADAGEHTAHVRVCTPDGGEEGYWSVDEWADPDVGEEALGAIIGAAAGQLRVRVPN